MVMKPNYFVFFLVLVLGTAWASSAEAGYTFTVTEDYTNEYGDPGLDPLFNHSFPEGASVTPEESIGRWYFNGNLYDWKYVIFVTGTTTDTITFNLEPDWTIVEATVESLNGETAIFNGATGSRTFDDIAAGVDYWTVTSAEIGAIQSIELSSHQGYFGDITLTISAVPEPSVLLLLAGGIPLLAFFRRRKTR